MALSRLVFILAGLSIASSSLAAVNRYVVFFKDKTGTLYSTSNPIAFLSQRAIDRRTRQGITITETDFPINQNYIDGVKATGAETYFKSRWMNALLIQCDESLLTTIEALTYVDHIDYVAPNARLLINGRKKEILKIKGTKGSEVTDTQLQQLGIDEMHLDGFRGEGMLIAVFDAGFPGVDVTVPFQSIFSDGRIDLVGSTDIVSNSGNVFQYDSHGAEVFSVIAAYEAGKYTGGAYQANYQLYVTEDIATEYRIEEYNWLFAAELADSAGVDIINSSVGYYDFDDASMNYSKADMDGKTTIITRAAQMVADRGVLVVVAAGNEGGNAWQMISSPADAVDVLAVANVNSSGTRASTSSIGPSADGRIKPDVAAMGTGTSIITPGGSVSTINGTSVSTPLITSLAAGLWQHDPSLTNKALMNTIKMSASKSANPDNLLGYGIPNYRGIVSRVEHPLQNRMFDVYPNPALSGFVYIKPIASNTTFDLRIQLLSTQGQLMYDGDTRISTLNPTATINISSLASGVYLMRIVSNDKIFTYKLVKI